MKKPIAGLIILVIFTAFCCGIDKVKELISSIFAGGRSIIENIFPTLKPLVSNMGIKEAVIVLIIVGLVTGVPAFIGCKLTKKDKRKVKRTIKDGVEIASKVSEFTSARKGK